MLDHRRDRQACVYLLHAAPLECNSQSDAATTTTGDTLLECATLDRQAHPHRARPELSPATYRAWVSLYTSYDVSTCIALRHHLREAFTAYTYP